MAEKEQIPLSLSRARVALEEEEDLLPVRLRVPKAIAQAVGSDPAAAVRALAAAGEKMLADITSTGTTVGTAPGGQLKVQGPGWPANEDPATYTNWETKEPPPCPGFWDVTDSKSGTLNVRWWFGGVWWLMGDPHEAGRTGVLLSGRTHSQFSTQYAWRGLVECPDDPYPLPPYSLATVPPGGGIDGKYLKRKRVKGA